MTGPNPPPGPGDAAPGRGWLRGLVEPSPRITSPEERRRARLSSVVSLVLLAAGALYVGISFLTTGFGQRAQVSEATTLAELVAVLFVGVSYALSRTRHHQAGILLAGTVMNGAILLLWFVLGRQQHELLYWLSVAMMVASLVLGFWRAAAFSVANIAATSMLLYAFAAPGDRPSDALYHVFYLAVIAVVLQAGGLLLRRDQARLEAQARELEVSEGRFRAMADNLPEAVFITAPDLSRTYYASPAYATIWGRPTETLYQNPMAWLDAIRADDRARILKQLSAGPAPTQEETTFHILRPDGSQRTVRTRTFPIRSRDGKQVLAAGIAEDITAFEQAERVLVESNARMRQTEEFRLRMIQTIAHDLQSPLTPIKIQAELLRGELGDAPASRAEGLRIIDRNADYVANLVRDLRDVAKIEAGNLKLDRRTLDVSQVARHAVETFRPVAKAKGVELSHEVQEGLAIDGDSQRVAQVLYNFLSNALKFTPPGGWVKVAARPEEDTVRLSVQDSGRGLTPEEILRLFQPFSQVHQPGETKERGTGLGLYISKGLVAAHGGQVWVESKGHGHGATFVAQFPPAATKST